MKSNTIYRCIRGLAFLSLLYLHQACGSARRGEPTQPPLSLEQEQVVKGRLVFMEYCHTCHPGGATGLGPAINNKLLPGFLIRYQVRHGLGVMPAFKKDHISETELDQLVAFLKVLRRHD